jgi:hypothetical protein
LFILANLQKNKNLSDDRRAARHHSWTSYLCIFRHSISHSCVLVCCCSSWGVNTIIKRSTSGNFRWWLCAYINNRKWEATEERFLSPHNTQQLLYI